MAAPRPRPNKVFSGLKRAQFAAATLIAALSLAGCSSNRAKNRYILAEKLWNEGNYLASVREFEEVITKDPHGKLGLQALYRAATTQVYFLSQYDEGLRKLRAYTELTTDAETGWQAQKLIGEILFSKLEHYDAALQQYQKLIQMNPVAPEVPEFLYRQGKSHFFLSRFPQSIEVFKKIMAQYSGTEWAEKASYQIGMVHMTRAGRNEAAAHDLYAQALAAFRAFIKQYPKSPLISEARFGIASCYEEMDQLDPALELYQELRKDYPSPAVIEVKLARIQQRKMNRGQHRIGAAIPPKFKVQEPEDDHSE